MIYTPHDILTAADSRNTNVAANTVDGPIVIVPQPGAGFRYRVWAAKLGSLPARTGKLWWEVRIGAQQVAELVADSNGGGDFILIPGGIIISENSSLSTRNSSSGVSQSLRGWIYYTIEPV